MGPASGTGVSPARKPNACFRRSGASSRRGIIGAFGSAAAPKTSPDRRARPAWLLPCAALVFVLVSVGGITRLTRSVLSIDEWQPLIGTIPPLSQADWQELFAKYRETPEFR